MRHLPGETIVICDPWQSWNWKPPPQQGSDSNISNVCQGVYSFLFLSPSGDLRISLDVPRMFSWYLWDTSGGCGNSGWFGGPDDESIFKWKYGHWWFQIIWRSRSLWWSKSKFSWKYGPGWSQKNRWSQVFDNSKWFSIGSRDFGNPKVSGDNVVSGVVIVEQHLFQLFISKMGDYRGEADESRWWRTGKIKFTSHSTLMMITTMMATLNPLWRPGSSNSNHSSAHSHFLSPHISPVNSPAIRWSLPSIVFCHCRHYCHRNCLIRASQRVPEENLALVAQPQVSNAIAAQLKSKNFLISSNHYVMTPHLQMCANKT